MHVIINTAALREAEVPIENSAAERVRLGFNPSTLPRVDRVKALAAALISELETAGLETADPKAEGELERAKQDVQSACMFGVAAITAHLGPRA